MGGGVAATIEDPRHGKLPDNCKPENHDLLVRATFVDFGDTCEERPGQDLTYCGSATGNAGLDGSDRTEKDERISCTESSNITTPVRWCIQTRCSCLRGFTKEMLKHYHIEDEPTREQGCPNVTACRPRDAPCLYNYDPYYRTANHCCAGLNCVYPPNSPDGTCQPAPRMCFPQSPPPRRCFPRFGRRVLSSSFSVEASSLDATSTLSTEPGAVSVETDTDFVATSGGESLRPVSGAGGTGSSTEPEVGGAGGMPIEWECEEAPPVELEPIGPTDCPETETEVVDPSDYVFDAGAEALPASD
jgi:hypothetical protein